MAVHNSSSKKNADNMASRFRSKGYNASVYKKGKGYGISVTRGIKKRR